MIIMTNINKKDICKEASAKLLLCLPVAKTIRTEIDK